MHRRKQQTLLGRWLAFGGKAPPNSNCNDDSTQSSMDKRVVMLRSIRSTPSGRSSADGSSSQQSQRSFRRRSREAPSTSAEEPVFLVPNTTSDDEDDSQFASSNWEHPLQKSLKSCNLDDTGSSHSLGGFSHKLSPTKSPSKSLTVPSSPVKKKTKPEKMETHMQNDMSPTTAMHSEEFQKTIDKLLLKQSQKAAARALHTAHIKEQVSHVLVQRLAEIVLPTALLDDDAMSTHSLELEDLEEEDRATPVMRSSSHTQRTHPSSHTRGTSTHHTSTHHTSTHHTSTHHTSTHGTSSNDEDSTSSCSGDTDDGSVEVFERPRHVTGHVTRAQPMMIAEDPLRLYSSTSRFEEFLTSPEARLLPLRENASTSFISYYHSPYPVGQGEMLLDHRHSTAYHDEEEDDVQAVVSPALPNPLCPTATVPKPTMGANAVAPNNRLQSSFSSIYHASAASLNFEDFAAESPSRRSGASTATRSPSVAARHVSPSSAASLHPMTQEERNMIQLVVDRSLNDSHITYQDSRSSMERCHNSAAAVSVSSVYYDQTNSNNSAQSFGSKWMDNSRGSMLVMSEEEVAEEEERLMLEIAMERSLQDSVSGSDRSAASMPSAARRHDDHRSAASAASANRSIRSERSADATHIQQSRLQTFLSRDSRHSNTAPGRHHHAPPPPTFTSGASSLLKEMEDYEDIDEAALLSPISRSPPGQHRHQTSWSGPHNFSAQHHVQRISATNVSTFDGRSRPLYDWERALLARDGYYDERSSNRYASPHSSPHRRAPPLPPPMQQVSSHSPHHQTQGDWLRHSLSRSPSGGSALGIGDPIRGRAYTAGAVRAGPNEAWVQSPLRRPETEEERVARVERDMVELAMERSMRDAREAKARQHASGGSSVARTLYTT